MDEALTKQIAALGSQHVAVRRAAAEALLQLGKEAGPAAVGLARAASDTDEQVRESAAGALEELGPPDAAAVKELTGLLSPESSDTAYWSATLLGRLGPAGSSAAPALIAVLIGDGASNVKEQAAWALGQIGASDAATVEALRQAAASSRPRLARLAKAALAAIGKA